MLDSRNQPRPAVTESNGFADGNEVIMREATAWVMRLTSGEATAADAEALRRWRAQSQAHRKAFAEANLMWDTLGPAARMTAGKSGAVLPFGGSRQTVHRHLGRRAFLGGAIAATAASVYAVVYPPFDLWPSAAALTADYRTGTGERRRVAVARDVSVELNTQTSVALRSGADAAGRIELISGEAAITTEGKAAVPFVVIANGGRTTASEAEFNVRLDGSLVRVTCLDGSVAVACRGREATLQAKQQISYDSHGLSSAEPADADVVTAWQRGLLVFRYEPLAHVIEEVNRYRPGRIIVTNTALGRRSVVANFRLDRLDDAVDHVAEAFGARVTRLPKGIVLLS